MEHFQPFGPKGLAWDKCIQQLVVFWHEEDTECQFCSTLLVVGTSPPSDMFTTGYEKEKEELPKTMRHQERKGKVKKESGTQIKSNLIWDTKCI